MKNDIIVKNNKNTKKETVNKGTATKVLATAGATLLQILLSSAMSATIIGSVTLLSQVISSGKEAIEKSKFNNDFLAKIATEIDNKELVVDKKLDDKFSNFYKSVCGDNFIPKKKLYEQLVEFAVKIDEGCGEEELNAIGNENLKALVEILVDSTKLQVEESISDDIKLYVKTEIEKNGVTRTNILYDADFPFENVNFIKREDDNKIDLLEKIDSEFSKNRIVVITSTSDNNHSQFPGGIGKTTLAVQYLREQIEKNKELKFKAVTFNNDNAKFDDLLKKVLGINENTLQNEKEKLLEEFAVKDDNIIFIDNVNILDDEFCSNLIKSCGKRVLITARSFSNDSFNISKIELSEFDYENARKLFFDLYKPDYSENDEDIFKRVVYNWFCGGNAKGLELIAKILKNAYITLEDYAKDFNEINVNVTSSVKVNGNYKENTFNEKIVELFKLSSIFQETDEEVNAKITECFRIMIYAGMDNLPFDGLKEFFGFKPYLNNTFIDRLVKNGLITVTGDNKFFHTHPIVVQALKAYNIDETVAEERTKLFVFCQLGGVAKVLPKIKVADIPYGVKYLDSMAFGPYLSEENPQLFESFFIPMCSYLEKVIIPSSVTKISNGAFFECFSLKDIAISNSVTNIGNAAFFDCLSLKSVIIPSSLVCFGKQVFFGCESLTSIDVLNDNQNYKSIDGNLYSKDGKTLIQYAIGKNDTSFTIPNFVNNIGYCGFSSSNSLISVVLSDNITNIGYGAFSNCDSLKSVTIGNSVISIEESSFYCCKSLTNINIPNSVISIGIYAFSNCGNLSTVYYNGSSKEWKKIKIAEGNDCLLNAEIIYLGDKK